MKSRTKPRKSRSGPGSASSDSTYQPGTNISLLSPLCSSFRRNLPNHSLDASPVKHGKDVTQLNTKASDMNRNFIKPLTLAGFAVTPFLASAAPPFRGSARAQQTSDVPNVKTNAVTEDPH